MNRQQTIIVVLSTVGVFALIALLGWLLQNTAAGPAGPGLDPTQRFVAQPGTTRDKALVLTTEHRPPTGDFADADPAPPEGLDGTDEQERRFLVRSLSPAPEDLTPAERTVRAAMNKLDPAQGIAHIDATLATLDPADRHHALHLAKARLAAQTDPPDWTLAQAALDEARSVAPLGEARQEVALASARLALDAGNPGIALKHVAEGLAEEGDGTARLHLLGLAGQLEAGRDAADKARAHWEQAIEIGETLSADDRRGLEGTLRAIALRLAQHHRDEDREDDARAVQETVQALFDE